MNSLDKLPDNLPRPQDDGACNHLIGQPMPSITLRASNDKLINLNEIKGNLVIYCYPMTGRPDKSLPVG